MKNIPSTKIAIIACSTDWMPADLAIERTRKLAETYINKYGKTEVYECPICITDNEINVKRVMKDVVKAECDAVCLYWANYGPESAGTLFAQEFNGPVMMIAAAEVGDEPYGLNRTDALSGFINACYALKLRKKNVYIPTNPVGTIDECVEMLHRFIPIARSIAALNCLKVISFGPRPSSYLAAYAPSHYLYNLGIDISEFSELELLDSYNKHADDKRIESVAADMEEELGAGGNKYPESLSKFAQYEITVNDWIRGHKGNRKYVTMTSTCWPAFPVNFGFVPCYVNSRLTAKGIPVACEVDVYGAVSEYIGQCISEKAVAILNINNNVPKEFYEHKIKGMEFNGKSYELDDLFIGYHCGVTASCLLKNGRMEPHFVNNLLIGEEKSKGTLHGQLKDAAVTIFRLQVNADGNLQAYIAQGQILPVEMDTYGGFGIIAIPEMRRFIRNVILEKQFPNHTIVIYGHYGAELMALMQQIGVKDIFFNHTKNIPYENENIFETENSWF